MDAGDDDDEENHEIPSTSSNKRIFEGKLVGRSQYYKLKKRKREEDIAAAAARHKELEEVDQTLQQLLENDGDELFEYGEVQEDVENSSENYDPGSPFINPPEEESRESSGPGYEEIYEFHSNPGEDSNEHGEVDDPNIFLNLSELANQCNKEPVENDVVTRQKNEIAAIFAKHNITHAAQRDLLSMFRNILPATQLSLPIQGRTLRPENIPHLLIQIDEGEFVYFGIAAVLTLTRFYNPEETVIRLSINMDGMPPFRSSSYNFWPILAAVDNQPEFMVALYGGPSKPKCSNAYLDLFVKEVCYLQKNGIKLHGKTFRFQLYNILMDVPATSYILGTIGHGGYFACRRCFTEGKMVTLPGRVSKIGVPCGTMCYPEMDAPARTSEDFQIHYDLIDRDPHVSTLNTTTEPENDESNSDDLVSDDEEENLDVIRRSDPTNESFWKHHKHPTILTKIKNFDLVKDVPIEYMHAVCLGICYLLLKKLSEKEKSMTSALMTSARNFCPSEFQRRPEKLGKLKRWKANQFRVFLLYIGAVVLKNVLNIERYSHFCYLVVALRLMCRKVPKSEERKNIIKKVSGRVRPILRDFMRIGINLYGEKFATYNVHAFCLHAPDDYERFGSSDEYSVFRFESFLGWLKKQVLSGHNPMQQIINKYSTYLLTGTMRKYGSKPPEFLDEYFEMPDFKVECEEDDYQILSQICYKSFCLRTNNDRDCHAYIDKSFVRLTQIVRQISSGCILIRGRRYKKVDSVFTEPMNSIEVGMAVCSMLSPELETWNVDAVADKCFAFPILLNEEDDERSEWAIARYLH